MKRTCIFLFALVFLVFTAAANAQVTSLTLNSDPGDFIGQGQSLFLTPADGTFSATTNFDAGVSVSFFGPAHFWFLDFSAAGNVPLTVGTYTGATRFPFQAFGENGLSVDGDGRGCNTLSAVSPCWKSIMDRLAASTPLTPRLSNIAKAQPRPCEARSGSMPTR